MTKISALFLLALGFFTSLSPGDTPDAPLPLQPDITAQDLDPAAFRQWVDGAEGPITPAIQWDGLNILDYLVALHDPARGFTFQLGREIYFADSKNAGPRHLRIGFTRPVPVGSIIGWASTRISVLKPNAPYPGNLADDSQWIPAERWTPADVWPMNGPIGEPGVTTTEIPVTRDRKMIWILPPGTVTRAIRFTRVANPGDNAAYGYGGLLGPICVLPQRYADAALFADIWAGAGQVGVPALTDFKNWWARWYLGSAEPNAKPVSPEHPTCITLAWPREVSLKGLILSQPNFSSAEVELWTGAGNLRARDISRSTDWKLLASVRDPSYKDMHWIDFGGEVKVRAIRLRITAPLANNQNTLAEGVAAANGALVGLGQLIVPTDIGDKPLASLIPVKPKSVATHPPIPIQFSLKEPGYVTLVIEDSTGKRVRNLMSETPFPAGENTAWWDGMDDLGRDPDAASHGIYHVFGNWVTPGKYSVRGLFRKEITLHYEMSVNDSGSPPWLIADGTGGWLAEHSPPNSIVFLPGEHPQIAIGSSMGENSHDLVLTDLDGRKMWGTHFASGVWRGVGLMARDVGNAPAAPPNSKSPAVLYFALGDTDPNKNTVLTLNALGDNVTGPDGTISRPPMAIFPLAADCVVAGPNTPNYSTGFGATTARNNLGGMAARNGIVAVSVIFANRIVFVNTAQAKLVAEATVDSPRGLAYDSQGRLLVLSGKKLLRFATPNLASAVPVPAPANAPKVDLGNPETLVEGLEDPCALTLDSAGKIYLTDWGQSHQVKVYDPEGKPLRTIGHAGAPKLGPYDRLHMNNPKSVTVDSNGRIWVAEESELPKRITSWNSDGTLWKAFYGPDEYAGGGSLDPKDKSLFYYRDMQWKLDWDKNTSEPTAIYTAAGPFDTIGLHNGNWHWLDKPIYYKDRLYLTDSFESNVDVGGGDATLLYELRNGIAVPVAAVGHASGWSMLYGNAYRAGIGWGSLPFDYAKLWPPDFTAIINHPPKPNDWWGGYWASLVPVDFAWSDLNGDGKVEPDEVKMFEGNYGNSFTIQDDLSVVSSSGVRIAPIRFTDQGAPVYDITKGEMLIPTGGAKLGNTQALVDKKGWLFLTEAPRPFPDLSLGGTKDGKPMWSYPDLWPGIHPSHDAPQPTMRGELVGTSHLLGGFVTPKDSDAGPIVGLNANLGNFYLFTSDGLFVTTLFRNTWEKGPWSMPQATRNMDVTNTTHWTEDFLPTINQTDDGKIYVVAMPQHSAIIRVDGLESVRRIPPMSLEVTPKLLAQAQAYDLQVAADTIKDQGRNEIDVPILPTPPTVDGKLDEWASADWATIDSENTTVNNFSTSYVENRVALAVSGDRLYAAFQVHDPGLLTNTDEDLKALFKTGGALDIMIGADSNADPKRVNPVQGDIRLLVTQHDNKTVAAVFRAVVPGTKNPVPFSSPSRTITLDAVDDVSSLVQLAGADGNFEMSIPLSALGLHPAPGQVIRGDVGILRGNGFQTIRRSYWQNKATGLVADVPGEAMLTPQLWGSFKFTPPPP